MVPTVNSDGTAYTLQAITHPVQVVTLSFDTDGYYLDVNRYTTGLYLFKTVTAIGTPSIKIRLQGSDGSYVVVGQPGPFLFCLIERVTIYSGFTAAGTAYTLRDFANGKIYHNEYNENKAKWTYSEISNFVETVNGTGPDADGNVTT